MKSKLLFAVQAPPDVMAEAIKEFEIISEPESSLPITRVIELANKHQVDGILISMGQKFGQSEIAQLPKSVRIVATCSVGFDHLDVAAFNAKQILVTNTPDVLTNATADQAMMLMLGACRRVRESIYVTDRGWGQKLSLIDLLGTDLSGRKIGILGMGRIGQAVARRAKGFGMEVMYCNRNRLPTDLEQGARFFENFHEMLPHCQVLSLHAPGTPETEKIMSTKEFSLLPKGAIFVNVARGSLVDENALFSAAKSGHLFGAGVDVCLNEPNPDPRFFSTANILLTPHVGSATRETRNEMGFRALQNVRMALSGERPRDQLS